MFLVFPSEKGKGAQFLRTARLCGCLHHGPNAKRSCVPGWAAQLRCYVLVGSGVVGIIAGSTAQCKGISRKISKFVHPGRFARPLRDNLCAELRKLSFRKRIWAKNVSFLKKISSQIPFSPPAGGAFQRICSRKVRNIPCFIFLRMMSCTSLAVMRPSQWNHHRTSVIMSEANSRAYRSA